MSLTPELTLRHSVRHYIWSQFLKLLPEHLSIHVGSPIHSLQNTDVNQEWLSFALVTEATSLLVINIFFSNYSCFVFWRSLQSLKKNYGKKRIFPLRTIWVWPSRGDANGFSSRHGVREALWTGADDLTGRSCCQLKERTGYCVARKASYHNSELFCYLYTYESIDNKYTGLCPRSWHRDPKILVTFWMIRIQGASCILIFVLDLVSDTRLLRPS